jgi:hypothetical protein
MGLRVVQPLFVFGCQSQQFLYRGLIMNLSGEAAASGDLDQQIGPLTADLIRQPRHNGVVYNASFFVGSVADVECYFLLVGGGLTPVCYQTAQSCGRAAKAPNRVRRLAALTTRLQRCRLHNSGRLI